MAFRAGRGRTKKIYITFFCSPFYFWFTVPGVSKEEPVSLFARSLYHSKRSNLFPFSCFTFRFCFLGFSDLLSFQFTTLLIQFSDFRFIGREKDWIFWVLAQSLKPLNFFPSSSFCCWEIYWVVIFCAFLALPRCLNRLKSHKLELFFYFFFKLWWVSFQACIQLWVLFRCLYWVFELFKFNLMAGCSFKRKIKAWFGRNGIYWGTWCECFA